MKQISMILLLLSLGFFAIAQDEEPTGMPGDNFSLEGALELFRQSSSVEDFEKKINAQDNHVNNLDFDEDGQIDYIKVISKDEDDIHIFILQVAVSENENQDIAVIELEKNGNNSAIIQIVGDEDVYGEEIIVEPSDEEDTDDGKSGIVSIDDYVVVNVWGWPVVRHVYGPSYKPWVSPWRWRSYPSWWSPWRPLSWSVWHPYRVTHYRPTVRITSTHRVVRAHGVYKPVRATSTTVRTKHATARANYKVNRTRTKVTGPRGNSVTKKTTTVRGAKGNVKVKKTKVKKGKNN